MSSHPLLTIQESHIQLNAFMLRREMNCKIEFSNDIDAMVTLMLKLGSALRQPTLQTASPFLMQTYYSVFASPDRFQLHALLCLYFGYLGMQHEYLHLQSMLWSQVTVHKYMKPPLEISQH